MNETVPKHSKYWSEALKTLGEVHIADRGGSEAEGTPGLFCFNRGHFCFSESDNFPNPVDPKSIAKTIDFMLYGQAKVIAEKLGSGITAWGAIEPFTSFFPEIGPNSHLLFRKFRKVLDPNSICAPGRQVYTEEEMNAVPEQESAAINRMRTLHGLEPINLNKGKK